MRPIPPPYLRAEVRSLLIWTAADLVGMAVSLVAMSGLLAWTHHARLSGLDAIVGVIYALLAFDHFAWARQIERADRPWGAHDPRPLRRPSAPNCRKSRIKSGGKNRHALHPPGQRRPRLSCWEG